MIKVKELIEDLKELPPDNKLHIVYWHENEPEERVVCDVHDIGIYTGIGISYLEIVGRDKRE